MSAREKPGTEAWQWALGERDRERERAVRWEALARQLGDALAELIDEHDEEIEGAPCAPLDRSRAALSVYRDAIKEET